MRLKTFESNFFWHLLGKIWSKWKSKIPEKVWECKRKTGILVFTRKMLSIKVKLIIGKGVHADYSHSKGMFKIFCYKHTNCDGVLQILNKKGVLH